MIELYCTGEIKKKGALTRSLNKINTDKRVPIDLQSGIHINNATLSIQQDKV